MNALTVEDLVYSYSNGRSAQKNPALDGLSFSVEETHVFGILGPNGGGKSTTFKILSTLIKPQSGRVSIFGINVLKHPSQVRSQMGIVFQSPALDKKLTVEENLLHHGHLYGLSGVTLRKRAHELLDRMGLLDRLKEATEVLSGGLKRRLEITKCLLHSPKLLILDEPTTGLDPLARREIWSYLHYLRREDKITVLVTTHLLDEADDCDEIALINKGKVVCTGTPATLRQTVGEDLISIRSTQAQILSKQLQDKFGLTSTLLGNDIRIQNKNAPELVPALIASFREEMDSITVGKPTLEDLFIQKTGHRFWQVPEGSVS